MRNIKEMIQQHLRKIYRGQLGLDALEVAGGTFVVLGILLGIGAYVLAQVKSNVPGLTCQGVTTLCDASANSGNQVATAANGIFVNTLAGVNQFSIWLPIIAIVIAAAIVLGIVLMTLGRQGHGGAV
jgi:hypothetical protein